MKLHLKEIKVENLGSNPKLKLAIPLPSPFCCLFWHTWWTTPPTRHNNNKNREQNSLFFHQNAIRSLFFLAPWMIYSATFLPSIFIISLNYLWIIFLHKGKRREKSSHEFFALRSARFCTNCIKAIRLDVFASTLQCSSKHEITRIDWIDKTTITRRLNSEIPLALRGDADKNFYREFLFQNGCIDCSINEFSIKLRS